MRSLPKLILDTNVCGKLVTPAYREDLERIKARIAHNFRVVVSPITFCELLDGLQGGDGNQFQSDKERFRLMVGNGKPKFLPLPATFAFWKVLRLKVPVAKVGPDDLFRCFRILLHAKSRPELFGGDVRLTGHGIKGRWGFDPQIIRQQHDKGRTLFRAALKKLKNGGSAFPEPQEWASHLGVVMGYSLDDHQALTLATALAAAYRYDSALFATVATSPYNLEKHKGDWPDSQQLYYLCDPGMFLLTDDSDLRKRVESSLQRDRVLDLREFLMQHGLTPRH